MFIDPCPQTFFICIFECMHMVLCDFCDGITLSLSWSYMSVLTYWPCLDTVSFYDVGYEGSSIAPVQHQVVWFIGLFVAIWWASIFWKALPFYYVSFKIVGIMSFILSWSGECPNLVWYPWFRGFLKCRLDCWFWILAFSCDLSILIFILVDFCCSLSLLLCSRC